MFLPHSDKEVGEILQRLGLSSLEDLFSHIDPSLLEPPKKLPEPKSEEELRRYFKELASLNRPFVCFAGGADGGYKPSLQAGGSNIPFGPQG